MAVDARAVLNYQANDADHRTFAQAIHDQLVAIGLTQTSDTGQANLATITRPSTGNVSGYEVFRFNDTEQATLACFIKVEYGTQGNATNPALRFTVGTATNGAGTLSNSSGDTGIGAWTSSQDAPAGTRPSFASYGEGQFIHVFGQDLTNAGRGSFAYIGRPRSYDGTRTTDALIMHRRTGSNSTGANSYSYTIRAAGGGSSSPNVNLPVYATLTGMDDQVGANVALFPVPWAVNGAIRWSSLFAYRSAAIAGDAEQSVTVFGGAKNYRALGNQYINSDIAFAVPYF